MTQPPTTRGPLGQLLEHAKARSGLQWRDIERGSGIPLPTIQAWVSGRTPEPPLRGVLHLALYLGVDPGELIKAALDGYTPPLARNGAAPVAPAGATPAGRVGEVLDVREGRRAERVRRSQAKRRGRGQV